MERDPELPRTGPSGALVERVGEHVAAANQVLQASRKAAVQARARVQQTRGRIGQTSQRPQDSAGTA